MNRIVPARILTSKRLDPQRGMVRQILDRLDVIAGPKPLLQIRRRLDHADDLVVGGVGRSPASARRTNPRRAAAGSSTSRSATGRPSRSSCSAPSAASPGCRGCSACCSSGNHEPNATRTMSRNHCPQASAISGRPGTSGKHSRSNIASPSSASALLSGRSGMSDRPFSSRSSQSGQLRSHISRRNQLAKCRIQIRPLSLKQRALFLAKIYRWIENRFVVLLHHRAEFTPGANIALREQVPEFFRYLRVEPVSGKNTLL